MARDFGIRVYPNAERGASNDMNDQRERSDAASRSYETITVADLGILSLLAESDRTKFFRKRPEYGDRVLCVALCQGAGLHYVDVARRHEPPNGVKDFDVWTFFSAVPGERFPADRRNVHVDLGPSRFGRYDNEPPRFAHYTGRRVDLLMRALSVGDGVDPADALRSYLRRGATTSAVMLARKGVVLIDPDDRRGEIVWPEP
jgi:hypothetical protein